jgi:hypothetical protein
MIFVRELLACQYTCTVKINNHDSYFQLTFMNKGRRGMECKARKLMLRFICKLKKCYKA